MRGKYLATADLASRWEREPGREGYSLLLAEHAQTGIELARQNIPDLILLDIRHPGMDGVTALNILRNDPRTRAIPVAALTAYAMMGDREKLLASGFDAYIEKPVDNLKFLQEVAALAGRAVASG